MPLRACEECQEMADDAKAFCPSCGHAFVKEQKREQPSEFQNMDGTMQLGQTMYNQMLSDMGLNLGDTTQPPQASRTHVEAAPAASIHRTAPKTRAVDIPEDKKRRNKFLIFGIIAAFLILGSLIVIGAAIVLWMRFG
jgi:hypothetical protein